MFTWSFSTHKEHSASWYVVALIVVLSLVLYGIIEGIYLLSIVAFLFAGVYILMENNVSPVTHVEVNEIGIKVGGSFYEYSTLARFAVIYNEDIPVILRLTPLKKLATIIDIPLTQDVNAVELKNYLASFLEEQKDVSLSNSDVLIHAMRL